MEMAAHAHLPLKYVNLIVKHPTPAQDGAVTHFRMKRVTQLKRVRSRLLHDVIFANVILTQPLQLIDSFCQRQSLDSRAVWYFF
jgi:hypothetical protein